MSEPETKRSLAELEQENARLRTEVHALSQALAKGDEALAMVEIRLKLAYLSTIQALVRAIEARDPYTVGHAAMVSNLAVAIARRVNVSETDSERVRIAATLLDVGKVALDSRLLTKEEELTESEREALKKHVMYGAQIVEPIIYPWEIANLIFQHHERLDGSGYPQALQGEDIEFEARILGLADAFTAMVANRAYRRAHSPKDVMDFFAAEAGKTFDERCVTALTELLAGDAELRQQIENFQQSAAR